MNLAWASFASIIFYLGRRNILGELKQDTIVKIYGTHLYFEAVIKILDNWGSKGSYAIFYPSGVRSP